MVHNWLWAEAGMEDGYLCIGCLERRLGRWLVAEDFTDASVNDWSPWDTERLEMAKFAT